MDYDTLVASKSTAGSIAQWINRSTVPSTVVLTDAQALIYNKLRHFRMKSEATGVMSASNPYISLPSDFLDCKHLMITGTNKARLRKGGERAVQDRYEYDGSGNRLTGTPGWFYISGTRVYFDYQPDSAYPYLMPYYARPAALATVTNNTNFLTDENPRLLRTACMLVAVEFEKEVGQGQYDRTYWQAQFDKLIEEYQASSDIAEMGWDATAELP